MPSSELTVHTSLLFDPKKKAFLKDVSIKVDCDRGSILEVFARSTDNVISDNDIDLRGNDRVVMPGFVDAHTHIFLHSYE
jgi:cytosine/adenosine deaminase-related metal-dependent hydrolase